MRFLVTSLARVMISGVKFTFRWRTFPLPAWRERTLSMPKIRPVVANGLFCTWKNTETKTYCKMVRCTQLLYSKHINCIIITE